MCNSAMRSTLYAEVASGMEWLASMTTVIPPEDLKVSNPAKLEAALQSPLGVSAAFQAIQIASTFQSPEIGVFLSSDYFINTRRRLA